MSLANKALAVLAALAFFLPFVSFSCNSPYGKFSVDMSGQKLVQCYLSPCSPKDLLSSKLGILGRSIPDIGMPDSAKIGGKDGKDVGLNFVLFAAIAVVVAVVALFLGRGGELLSGLASVGAIVLLFMFRSKFGDAFAPQLNSPELKAAGEMVQFTIGYGAGFWACVVLSGLSALLAFKGTGGSTPVAAGAPGAAGGFAPPPRHGATPGSSEQLSVCSACGSVNSAGSKFCLSCGSAMAAPAVQNPENTSSSQGPVCPSCGSANAGSGKFCLACGASMAAAAAAAVPPPPPEPEKKVAPEPQGPVCPSCGSGNAGTGKFCLACGASMVAAAAVPPPPPEPEKKAAPEPQGPVCPSCGSGNAGTGKFCLACGASMVAAAAAAVASVPTPPPEPEKKAVVEPQGPVCPSCGSGNAGTGKFCLACGASMVAAAAAVQPPAPPEEKVAAAPQEAICPSCGASNSPTGKFCLSCGGSLMSTVQLFQPSETAHPPAAPAPAPPAAMAAQASASAPVGQPLRAVAPSPAPEPPPEMPVAISSSPVASDTPPADREPAPPAPPPPVAEQASLDWTAQSPEPPKAQSRVCPSCGARYTPDQQFCLVCGKSLPQVAAETETPAFAHSAEEAQPPATTQVFQPAPKSSSKAWIIIVLALAALGAGGYFGWKYFTRPDVTVTANVQRIHVAVGGKTALEANVSGSTDTDVDWSVQEGDKGGQVTASGTVMSSGQLHSAALYTAPQTAGTYHVIATSHANPGRSAKIEIIVGGFAPDASATTTEPAPPSSPTATTTTTPAVPAAASPAASFPNAAQIVGTWNGPGADMKTTIGADSTIAMASAANPQKNLNGTYHFTDNTHLDVDFGNGDVRKWEILGVDNTYLRISSQSKDGSSAIIFQKAQ